MLVRIDKDLAAMHDKPDVSLAYVQRIIDAVPTPENTSQEDYIRLMGRLQRQGIKGFVTLMTIPQGNQYFIDVMPDLIGHLWLICIITRLKGNSLVVIETVE